MNVRKKFKDRIRKKEQEIARLESELAEAKAYLQALNDSLKLLPRDSTEEEEAPTIRPGSLVGRALQVLRSENAPMHVNEMLTAMGLPRNKRNSLASQLAAYARRGDTFQRVAPNTYGLADWGEKAIVRDREEEDSGVDGPPADFGAVN